MMVRRHARAVRDERLRILHGSSLSRLGIDAIWKHSKQSQTSIATMTH